MKKRFIFLVSFLLVILSVISIKKVDNANSEIILATNESPVIIIDAGHGGEDGGAVATDNTVEKDLNLQIALKLNEVSSVFGYKTHMIRTTDTAIHTEGDTIRKRKVSDIKNRTAVMNEYENCLYISIHQNKFSDSSIKGAQTFYSPNDDRSRILAQFIQSSVQNTIQSDNTRKIKKSGTNIYVLYNATKPTVMVECGFISNPDELNNLKNDKYQSNMALAIAVGIMNYNISEVKNGSEV